MSKLYENNFIEFSTNKVIYNEILMHVVLQPIKIKSDLCTWKQFAFIKSLIRYAKHDINLRILGYRKQVSRFEFMEILRKRPYTRCCIRTVCECTEKCYPLKNAAYINIVKKSRLHTWTFWTFQQKLSIIIIDRSYSLCVLIVFGFSPPACSREPIPLFNSVCAIFGAQRTLKKWCTSQTPLSSLQVPNKATPTHQKQL